MNEREHNLEDIGDSIIEDGLILVRASDIQMKAHGHDEERWGGWEFDGCFLDFDDRYPIDLRVITGSAKMLDLIMQVAGKTWADDACLAGLVRALDTIFYPQSCLCSGGRGKRLTKRQVARRLAAHRIGR